MAVRDEQFVMPDGSVYVVRRPAAESDGAFVEMEFVLPSEQYVLVQARRNKTTNRCRLDPQMQLFRLF